MRWWRMRNINLSAKVINEEVFGLIGKKRTLPNKTLHREAS